MAPKQPKPTLINPEIKKGMPRTMIPLYEDFYSNEQRLKDEWELCTQQYRQSLELAMSEQGTVYHRLAVRKISDYWKKRRNALEASLPEYFVAQLKQVTQ
jgi:hypothetical protein